MDNYDSESYKVISERTFSAAESLTGKGSAVQAVYTHVVVFSGKYLIFLKINMFNIDFGFRICVLR